MPLNRSFLALIFAIATLAPVSALFKAEVFIPSVVFQARTWASETVKYFDFYTFDGVPVDFQPIFLDDMDRQREFMLSENQTHAEQLNSPPHREAE